MGSTTELGKVPRRTIVLGVTVSRTMPPKNEPSGVVRQTKTIKTIMLNHENSLRQCATSFLKLYVQESTAYSARKSEIGAAISPSVGGRGSPMLSTAFAPAGWKFGPWAKFKMHSFFRTWAFAQGRPPKGPGGQIIRRISWWRINRRSRMQLSFSLVFLTHCHE